MDVGVYFLVLVLLGFVSNASGKLTNLKLCVVGNHDKQPTRTTKYCDLLEKSKGSPVSCIYAANRLECLLAVSKRKADFSVFEAEDLYFSTFWDQSSLLVVSEIRALKKKPFRYGIVAMVRKDSNITGLVDLRGRRLCHPGLDSGPEWDYLSAQYFEERVAPANCEEGLSMREDRMKTSSNFFGAACKAGPWSVDSAEDARLKSKYWNLCSLCEGGDCSDMDKHRGSGGSLICFKDGVGDVLWARYEDVKAHIQFLESDLATLKFYFLCDNGTLMSLTTEEPCLWLAKPWQVIVANRKSASSVQKIVDVLSDDEHNDWEENLLHVIELYLEYVENLYVSRTPEDYLRGIPGYLSASAMSQGNCKPSHSVSLCVTSSVEEQKCDWMSKAGSALGIQPAVQCVQKANLTACLDSVGKKETDVVVVSPDFFYDAAVIHNLKWFLLETGTQFNDNYLSSVIVKKKSAVKKLSELRGRKVCLTRKHGFGWWSLVSALHRESLIGSSCGELEEFFGEVCDVRGIGKCCSMNGTGNDEMDVLQCFEKGGCDAAVLDSNTLMEYSGGESPQSWSKDSKVFDFDFICSSGEKKVGCHWMWSPPHYLMTHVEANSPRGAEIFEVFFQLGEYFGRHSRKGNSMLEIFGSFHDVRNVLFRDTSTSFTATDQWNRSNSYQQKMTEMKLCSEAPSQRPPLSFALLLIAIFFSNKISTSNVCLRLR